MEDYLNLLEDILELGVEKESGRANMPNTIGISKADIRMDLSEGFPLLTTKKMYWKGVVHELLWFLHGDTNIKYLVDNKVNIWNGDAYRWYLKWWDDNKTELEFLDVKKISTIEEFVQKIKNGEVKEYQWRVGSQGDKKYKLGDLGKVYGYQWRNQNGVDQVKDVLDGLKNNPYSRYHIIDAWNKADFRDMALPPCHLLYQFIVRPLTLKERLDRYGRDKIVSGLTDAEYHKHLDQSGEPRFYLDLNMYQRSCDTFLGVPFNLASMSLLLMIFAEANNMIAGVANWIGGDTHVYVDHVPMIREQLKRKERELPRMIIKKELNSLDDILALTIDDFELRGYNPHDAIKAELFTGLKKS